MRRVYTARDVLDARLICDLLTQAGLTAFVEGEATGGILPQDVNLAPAVCVPKEQFDDARRILGARSPARLLPPWTCPGCGEQLEGQFGACWQCGTERPETVSEPTSEPPVEPQQPAVLEASVEVDKSEFAIRTPVPWGTLAYAVLLIVLHALLEWRGGFSVETLKALGWRDAFAIWDGQWWAIATGTLLHRDRDHLTLNLTWLLVLGWGLERRLGTLRFLALLAASMVFSSSSAVASVGENGYGNSGVMYALLGFTLLSQARLRALPLWIFVPVMAWGFLGCLVDLANVISDMSGQPRAPELEIGSYAHLGGLLFGVLTALVFVVPGRRVVRGTAFGIFVVFSVLGLFWAPWQSPWCRYQVDSALKRGDAESVMRWSQWALQLAPRQNADLCHHRAIAQLNRRDLAAAMAEISRGINARPDLPALREMRAYLHLLQSEWDAAQQDLDASRAQPDTGPERVAYLALILQMTGRPEDAGDLLQETVAASPQHTLARIECAAWHLDQCHFADAQVQLDALDRSEVPLDHELQATTLIIRSQLARAGGDPDAAQEYAQKARSLVEDRAKAGFDPVQLTLAEASLELGDFDLAMAIADAMLAVTPKDVFLWQVRGLANLQADRPDKALADFERACALARQSHVCIALRARALAELGRSQQALIEADAALTISPRCLQAWIAKGAALRDLSRFDDAAKALDEAQSLCPHCEDVHFERSRLLLARGDRPAAEAERKKAIELEPSLNRRTWVRSKE